MCSKRVICSLYFQDVIFRSAAFFYFETNGIFLTETPRDPTGAAIFVEAS